MTDPDRILKEAIDPIVNGMFDGPATERLGHLESVIEVARALMVFSCDVAGIVAPGASRETILGFVARALAPAVREVIGRAGLGPERGRVLVAAVSLGLEAGAAGPARVSSPEEADRVRSLARVLEFAQALGGRGLDRDGLRTRLEAFAAGESDSLGRPSGRDDRAALGRVAVDAIVTSFFPPALSPEPSAHPPASRRPS